MGLIQTCFQGALKAVTTTASSSQQQQQQLEAAGGEKKQKKEYSWDRRREADGKDQARFIVENVRDAEVGRKPGEINGEQFLIRNCEGASVYLFDHINTISIDDCNNCQFFVGPTKGSLFIRDCSSCVIVAACGQFRTRDCKDIKAFICCPTQPIVEATTKAKFGCFQYWYPELTSHFSSAGLSPYNNLWWNVHDFTPTPGSVNWTTVGECFKVQDFMETPSDQGDLAKVGADSTREKSVVPLSVGTRRRDHDETSLLTVFSWSDVLRQTETVKAVLAELDRYSEVELIKSRSVQLQDQDAERIFGSKEHQSKCGRGPVVALQFGGPDCIEVCQKVARTIAEKSSCQDLISASSDGDSAASQILNLFNFADMQLGLS